MREDQPGGRIPPRWARFPRSPWMVQRRFLGDTTIGTVATGNLSSNGVGVLAFGGSSFVNATLTASGIDISNAVGASLASANIQSLGISILSGVGSSKTSVNFNSVGTSDVQFVGKSILGVSRYDGWKPRKNQDEEDLMELAALIVPFLHTNNSAMNQRQ